jgi:hypothetical protein
MLTEDLTFNYFRAAVLTEHATSLAIGAFPLPSDRRIKKQYQVIDGEILYYISWVVNF